MNCTNPDRLRLLDLINFSRLITRAEGHYLYDDEGNAYLDFLSQYGSVPFGHNSPVAWSAIARVRNTSGPALVQPFRSPAAEALASKLIELSPCGAGYVTFACSGAETVEAAIKLARARTGRTTIVSTSSGFHGKTLGALSATANPQYKLPFHIDTTGFYELPFGDLDSLNERLSSRDVAAFIVEPVQGEGGMKTPPPGYLKRASELCREHGTLFILDEIQTGLGRTGKLFAADHEGVEPDILLLAKALGGGLVPLSACICSKRAWSESFGMYHSSTFANNHLTCSVGLATLEHLLRDDRQLIKDVEEKGKFLAAGLQSLVERYPQAFSGTDGAGLMQGISLQPWELDDSYFLTHLSFVGMAVPVVCGYLLHQHRILTVPTINKASVVRVEPSLTVTFPEIEKLLIALEDVGRSIAAGNFSQLFRFVVEDSLSPELSPEAPLVLSALGGEAHVAETSTT